MYTAVRSMHGIEKVIVAYHNNECSEIEIKNREILSDWLTKVENRSCADCT